MLTSKEVEAKDVKQLLIRVYRRYLKGAITEAQATKESQLLNAILRAIETTELEARITEIETKLNK